MGSTQKKKLTPFQHVEGVRKGHRASIAQTITLIESSAAKHFEDAQSVLEQLMPYTGKSVRIGITGVPGAGKSTLIEELGMQLCESGFKVAVLAVDPSSSVNRGSILGDKTRMGRLSKHPDAYVRPSPTGGNLGGVAKKTRETMLVCEAAGYDVIIIETVGVGQSELTVRSLVDFFMVLMLTGGGDELQGIKKGLMEIADAVFINKADGSNKQPAELAKAEYNRLLHFLQPASPGWETKAYTVSALTGEGMDNIWNVIQSFKQTMKGNGHFDQRRREQVSEWMERLMIDELTSSFYQNEQLQEHFAQNKKLVQDGEKPLRKAIQELMEEYRQIQQKKEK
ncbi:methylmalonyl-CoA mutase metallochaperone MeaB [Sinobaca qinghaiensis]|uniref:Methylmalonyl-CoA mutase metallochaperone MeaB n=2 Tax=Sinobaca qinghaiensis TaxID=342944 RepID=A0A419V6U7_9BACL|nr:methylmalonyl-CoA mutase metallochaperone MeaB [Sinobaca qinghaiensis]